MQARVPIMIDYGSHESRQMGRDIFVTVLLGMAIAILLAVMA